MYSLSYMCYERIVTVVRKKIVIYRNLVNVSRIFYYVHSRLIQHMVAQWKGTLLFSEFKRGKHYI